MGAVNCLNYKGVNKSDVYTLNISVAAVVVVLGVVGLGGSDLKLA